MPTNRKIGIAKGASTLGGALLVNRTLGRGFSLAGRGEYISSTGNTRDGSVNLLYGPGSAAWSITLTPTFQHQRFFIRGDLALVRATSDTLGYGFGPAGMDRDQPRAVMEVGFMF